MIFLVYNIISLYIVLYNIVSNILSASIMAFGKKKKRFFYLKIHLGVQSGGNSLGSILVWFFDFRSPSFGDILRYPHKGYNRNSY